MNIKIFLQHRRTFRNIKRFNMENVLHPQNLADHGFNVVNLFYLLCRERGFSPSSEDMFIVLNHDFTECFTGDLNLVIKNKIPDLWNEMENSLLTREVKRFSDKGIKEHFLKYYDQKIYNLFLFADAYEAYLYCKDEISMGNKLLEPALIRYEEKLLKIDFNLFKELQREDFI